MTNTQKQFLIRSRYTIASDPLPTEPFIILSAQDPGSDDVEIPESPWCRGIHRMAFDEHHQPGWESIPMNSRHAKDMWQFIRDHADVSCIVCQCEYGLNRSAGLALGLSQAFGIDGEWIKQKHVPNLFVAGMVVEGRCG